MSLFKNVRARLTFWYAVALAVVLAIYSSGVFFFVRDNMLSELDRKLRVDIETTEELMQELPSNPKALEVTRSYPESRDRSQLEVWSESLIYSESGNKDSVFNNPGNECLGRAISYHSVELPDDIHMRLGCKTFSVGGRAYTIRAARSADRVYQEFNVILFVMGLGLPFAVGISVVGGYVVARRALSPIAKMTEQAQKISAARLSERLPVENPEDELGRLAVTFNKTFERLEKSFDQMKRFTSDASHELRTPLTAIRTMGEVSLKEGKTGIDHRETISSILEECDHLRHLVDNLLTLSRVDAGQIKLNKKEESLAQLVREVVGHLGVLAEEKDQKLNLNLDEKIRAFVDKAVLRQAIINLLDNAIKYSPKGTEVNVTLTLEKESIAIEVVDQGPGIAPEYSEKVFDRFYRIDEGRSRDQGGTGLGLSIAQWAVQSHDGQITLHSEAGRGSSFCIQIPSA